MIIIFVIVIVIVIIVVIKSLLQSPGGGTGKPCLLQGGIHRWRLFLSFSLSQIFSIIIFTRPKMFIGGISFYNFHSAKFTSTTNNAKEPQKANNVIRGKSNVEADQTVESPPKNGNYTATNQKSSSKDILQAYPASSLYDTQPVKRIFNKHINL